MSAEKVREKGGFYGACKIGGTTQKKRKRVERLWWDSFSNEMYTLRKQQTRRVNG